MFYLLLFFLLLLTNEDVTVKWMKVNVTDGYNYFECHQQMQLKVFPLICNKKITLVGFICALLFSFYWCSCELKEKKKETLSLWHLGWEVNIKWWNKTEEEKITNEKESRVIHYITSITCDSMSSASWSVKETVRCHESIITSCYTSYKVYLFHLFRLFGAGNEKFVQNIHCYHKKVREASDRCTFTRESESEVKIKITF